MDNKNKVDNTEMKVKIGKRINAALAKEDKKQKDLAKYLCVKDNTISYFCSGERAPNYKQLTEIANYLNVSTDYLLGMTDVSSVDSNLQAVCNYTGLSEKSIENLTKNCKIKFDLIDKGKSIEKPVAGAFDFIFENEQFKQLAGNIIIAYIQCQKYHNEMQELIQEKKQYGELLLELNKDSKIPINPKETAKLSAISAVKDFWDIMQKMIENTFGED